MKINSIIENLKSIIKEEKYSEAKLNSNTVKDLTSKPDH